MIYDSCECYSGDDCCCRGDMCCSDNYYANRQLLARAFALTGLLRKIGGGTPDDLVYVYLRDTDLCGVSSFMFGGKTEQDKSLQAHESDYIPNIRRYSSRVGTHVTKAIANMAHEYMVRCYWEHLDNLVNMTSSTPRNTKGTFETTRLYPLYVRQALDTLAIPGSSEVELKDVKNQIDALYTSICPMATDKTGWRERDITNEGVDVLSISNIRKINTLLSIYYRCSSKHRERNELPDAFCRETICNLIDCLVMICCDNCRFSEARRYKQLYEFSKLGKSFTGVKSSPLRYDNTYTIQDGFKGEVDAALWLYSHMSPEAAICVGNNVAMYEMGYNGSTHAYGLKLNTFGDNLWHYPFTGMLKDINPNPVAEVELYMCKEIEFEKLKVKKLVADKHIPKGGLYGCSGCCNEAVPCEPCEA